MPHPRRLSHLLLLLTALCLTACFPPEDEFADDEVFDEEPIDEDQGVVEADEAVVEGDYPYFEATNCPGALPTSDRIECGVLYVLEDRSDPESYEVEIMVAILHAASTPRPDPIVYLAGGPGGSGILEADLWLDSTFNQDRDVILLDQRGTGFSYPSLNCVEVEELEDDSIEADLEATEACRDRLLDDEVDLTRYNSAESAADLAELRTALNIDEWNVVGISYGTRLALTYMRDYPEGIRSVILDSTYPPQVNAYVEEASNGASSFKALFDGCAADAACNAAYPNLESVFYETVDDLNIEPAVYVDYDGFDVEVYGDDLVSAIFDSLYDTTTIPYLPMVIYDTWAGQYDTLADLNDGVLVEAPLDEAAGGSLLDTLSDLLADYEDVSDSEGLYYSVECHEEAHFYSLDDTLAAAEAVHPSIRAGLAAGSEQIFDACAVWGAGQSPGVENEPVRSDIYTLIMAGEYDPVTPPAWGQAAADFLSASYFFIYPGVGHAAIDGGDCPEQMARAFLDNPSQSPDESCLASMTGPAFVVR